VPEPKPKRGRPRLEIDPKQVKALSSIGCTQEEIAAVMGCTVRTLRNRFAGEMRQGMETMRMSLRRWQYEKAKGGNVAMLIWLGKQYLGQREKADTTVTEQVVTIERIEPKLGLAESA
jgi:predicted transcriptional regulator